MSRLDWTAHRNRPRRPLISDADIRKFKEDAVKVAERIAKGHRSPQAHLHGLGRALSPEDRQAVVAALREAGRL